jgi:hypothetical protein
MRRVSQKEEGFEVNHLLICTMHAYGIEQSGPQMKNKYDRSVVLDFICFSLYSDFLILHSCSKRER